MGLEHGLRSAGAVHDGCGRWAAAWQVDLEMGVARARCHCEHCGVFSGVTWLVEYAELALKTARIRGIGCSA